MIVLKMLIARQILRSLRQHGARLSRERALHEGEHHLADDVDHEDHDGRDRGALDEHLRVEVADEQRQRHVGDVGEERQAGEAGWIADGKLTAAGLSALEPYRVRRTVFIAAGFGSRLVPITLNTPKPLVRVRGTRIIDALLDAVCAAGIEEIYIVRGYYGEQLDALLYKYPNIKFIENPMYSEANNISSLMAARYLLQGSYVIESDLLLSNPALIKKYQYHSNYLAIPMERSDDWCFDVNKKGVIERVRVGGDGGPFAFRGA